MSEVTQWRVAEPGFESRSGFPVWNEPAVPGVRTPPGSDMTCPDCHPPPWPNFIDTPMYTISGNLTRDVNSAAHDSWG